jgi:ribosomal protein S3
LSISRVENIKLNFNKKKLRLIKEKLAELRLFEKNPFFNEGINVFFTFIKNNESPELVTEFIANQLKQLKKNHNFFLKFIKAALTLLNNKRLGSNTDGIKIKIKGKFNKSPRARHKTITIGNLPLLTMTSNTHYSEKIAYSSNGTFGVKIWTYKNL